ALGSQTAAGTMKGKSAYMSPEQIEQRLKLDRRSDLFSLGIVLYEMTLGRRLFATRSEFHTLKRILEMPVPRPSMLDTSYDRRLEEIVMRALARDRRRRYQTARELQMDLEDLARARGMYLSMIALQQFMEGLFAHKRRAALQAGAAMAPSAAPVLSVEAALS